MAETTTPRLGLIKPAKDTSTPLDIDRLNLNSDRLDIVSGALNVANDFTPAVADLFDGMIVKEKTSGKVWIAEKQTNGSFSRRWVSYPWAIRASYSGSTGVFRSTWAEIGFSTFVAANSLNSKSTDVVAGRVRLPIPGVYAIRVWLNWQPYGLENQSGARIITLGSNGAASGAFFDSGRTRMNAGIQDGGQDIVQSAHYNCYFPGTLDLSIFAWQNSSTGSSGPLGISASEIEVSLISPSPAAT